MYAQVEPSAPTPPADLDAAFAAQQQRIKKVMSAPLGTRPAVQRQAQRAKKAAAATRRLARPTEPKPAQFAADAALAAKKSAEIATLSKPKPTALPARTKPARVPAVVEKEQAVQKQVKAKKKVPSIEELYKEGIDTMDEGDIGNWYLKRAAWKKARPRYQEIRKGVNQTVKLAQEFIGKKRNIDKILDNFYATVGIQQGEVIQILDDLMTSLEREHERLPDGLPEEQLKELADLRSKKLKDLDVLKSNFEFVRSLSNNLSEAILGTLQDQLALVHKYQEDALENYYKISEILNDKKAKELLDTMTNFSENIQAIQKWIKGPLNKYVDESLEKLKALVSDVTKEVEELRTQGIILKIGRESEEERLTTEQREKEEQARAKAQKKAAGQLPFFQKILNWFGSIISNIFSAIKSLFMSIFRPFARST